MPDIKFQRHAVATIQNAVTSQSFLDGRPNADSLLRSDCVVIDSLHNVERFQDPDWPGAVICEPLHWNDICGDADIPILNATRNHTVAEKITWNQQKDEAFRLCEPAFRARATDLLGELHGEDLITMIYEIISERAICGVLDDSLKQRFWTLIEYGGYPCGWSGDEHGQIVVVYAMRNRTPD